MYLYDEDEPAPIHTKAPAWVITFADLMSLLMCFFVLLLAYSEMDAKKFAQIANSMQESLGAGTTPNEGDALIPLPVQQDERAPASPDHTAEQDQEAKALMEKLNQTLAQTQADAQHLAERLQGQMERGELEIETEGQNIIVRLREKGSFESGSADLNPQARATLATIESVLQAKQGRILVLGHTDDIPIKTARFRSNWELSAVRAVAVADALMVSGVLAKSRFEVTGFADTRPLAANDNASGRGRNRRVEIVVSQELSANLTEKERLLLESAPSNPLLTPRAVRPRDKATLPDHIF
ncbi:MAG TPA: OmpA family protein [Cellvibrionaceae bacterium]